MPPGMGAWQPERLRYATACKARRVESRLLISMRVSSARPTRARQASTRPKEGRSSSRPDQNSARYASDAADDGADDDSDEPNDRSGHRRKAYATRRSDFSLPCDGQTNTVHLRQAAVTKTHRSG